MNAISLWEILVVAFALGGDAFSVCLVIGSNKRFKGQAFRLGFHFALFQSMMTLIGWYAGRPFVHWAQSWDHWLASGIVFVIAAHMLYEAIWPDEKKTEIDRSRGWFLVTLSLATSIDALAMGLAFSVLNVSPWNPSLVIGLVAGAMSLTGLYLGRTLRASIGQSIEIAGGLFLLLIAGKLFTI